MTQTNIEGYVHAIPDGSNLSAHHAKELFEESSILQEVAAERGYRTIERPNVSGNGMFSIPGIACVEGTSRDFLVRAGFPSWSTREDYYFPGLWIPQYTPTGQRYAGQWKPFRAVRNRDGKPMRYASAKGSARIDVHPRWSADRGQEDAAKLPAIQTVTERLWITEGVKKADALTSRGEVTVALSGVFNWRNTHAALGDWEDVRLKGREIVICFDADAITKPQVAKAMERLGKWLRYKGAAKVWYLVVPPGVNGKSVKGVDDFFAAGGNMKELERAFDTKPPKIVDTADAFTDARLAETLSDEVLDGSYVWAAGLDWLSWNGKVWQEVHEVSVLEAVRRWALDHFADAAARLRDMDGEAGGEVEGWKAVLSSSRQRAVLSLARGIVERKADDFDTDPDIFNTASGIVNLTNGELLPHEPDAMCTKMAGGSYRPGFTHPDWDAVLEALPAETRAWFQTRVGQAITGHTTPDGIVPIMQGGGENGKGTLVTDGILPAIGEYGSVASPKLFMSAKNEHSTERADLRGQRLVIAEELTEGRSIDVTALKQVADVGRIKARKTHKDNMEFDATHSIFATTNYIPIINETDHGTWRRLALVKFPYTFIKPGDPLDDPATQRRGDPTLKRRIKANPDGQHDAIVTWAVEGAMKWYASQSAIEAAVKAEAELPADVMRPCATVAADTRKWRIEADRILGFWTERLKPDPMAMVLTSELLEEFNAWLQSNGHAAWSKETFGPRFEGHAETVAHRITTKVTRDHGAIVRRPAPAGAFGPASRPLPKQARVWSGVRFALPDSDA